jgi:type IV pilus assembly protein PilW
MTRDCALYSRRHARGLTLVELMVALTLGLVVVGVVLANYLSARQAQRTSVALSRMTEDATAAFSVMRRYVSMAGYSTVDNATETGLSRAFAGRAVFGCSHGFANPLARDISGLSCTASNGTERPDALAVVYQATLANSLPGRRPGGPQEPTDLMGQVLHASTTPPYLAQARFLVINNGLHIAGNGGTTTPPAAGANLPAAGELLGNVADMRVWFGLSGVNGNGRPDQIVNRYVEAANIGAVTQADWRTVTAVRVCLLMVSEEPVFDTPTPYYPCQAATNTAAANTVTPGDRRLYRAYTTTIHLPNRLGG